MQTSKHISTTPLRSLDSYLKQFPIKPLLNSQAENLYCSYEMFFCDNFKLYKNEFTIPHYPWDILFCADSGVKDLEAIYNNKELETRPRIIASKLLERAGKPVDGKELMGVVLEIHQRNGLDVLAVYNDGTARYINHRGDMVVWETKTPQSVKLINILLGRAVDTLGGTEKITGNRSEFPKQEQVRISFLTSNGLFSLDGDYMKMRENNLTGSLIESGIQFMLFLINEQKRRSKITGKNVFAD